MDPFSAIASVIGSGINYFGQQETNKMQQQMMQQQQSFQERMSSTAYQRASTDMTAAGLNPMMMFSSGSAASTPAGASPSPNVKSGLDGDTVAKFLSTATQMRVADATINNLVEQNAKIKAETLTEGNRPENVLADSMVKYANRNRTDAEARTENERTDVVKNVATTSRNEMAIPKQVRKVADQLGYGGKKVDEILSPVSNVISSAKRARSLFDDRFHY